MASLPADEPWLILDGLPGQLHLQSFLCLHCVSRETHWRPKRPMAESEVDDPPERFGRVPQGFSASRFRSLPLLQTSAYPTCPIPRFSAGANVARLGAGGRIVKCFLACLFAAVLSARCVFADPIAIQAGGFAGVVDQGGFTGPSWDLRGAAFHLTGLFAGVVTGSPCPCAPGTTVSLGHGANVSGHGDVTLGSLVFNDVDLRATFDVQSSTTITLPSTIDPRGGIAFRLDFLLTGDVVGLRNGETLFTQAIIGSGSGGVVNFHPIVLPDGTATQYRDVANFYNFDELSGSPIQEPASFLLVATGTLTLLRRRQRS
jgi:hypothetical protein